MPAYRCFSAKHARASRYATLPGKVPRQRPYSRRPGSRPSQDRARSMVESLDGRKPDGSGALTKATPALAGNSPNLPTSALASPRSRDVPPARRRVTSIKEIYLEADGK
ncbi:MAG: hypothetical protein AVDCRST_MAG25-3040 [uncultured Rubrobacteraceae bacterium]|uniref:Uncharacterized protein n=1 Tax=uncultured Rubrobacteraceae bacterium TaxID=349277 RepID=A0A6J4RYV9_9ACTN|nr:MAG: hypothetical protein AVDCRST_MAG25-3040 [uncultured Rubrobacteraceae bacterium]